MAYYNNEPLNNRSGLGGKEKMEREKAKRATERQEEKIQSEEFERRLRDEANEARKDEDK